MAQTIKLKRSGTQGAAPTTSNLALGEVAINTYDGKMYIKKDVGGTESIVEVGGVSSGSVSYLEAGMIEYEYTATSNQTTFSGSDSNSATLSYTANSVLVFLNGVLQDDGVDYTATNGTSVVFGSALTANDEVRIVAFTNVTTASSLQDPTKLDAISTVNNQAAYSLTLSSSAYTPSSQNALIVSLNGITQEPGDSFTISGSTITFSPALVTGDVVDYIVDMGRAVTIGEYSGDLAVGGELEVTGDIIGDLRGATLFNAQAGEALSKGDVVYISGISGNTTVVSKADANDAAKMPAFGIASAAANLNASVDIYTFGRLSGLDTSAFSEGDELFVSTTAGALTSTAPTGESSKLQKIAKVTRSHASAGSIFIMGAGRSNAVPNLDDGDIFIGNASNQAVSVALDTSIVPENGNLYFTTARVDSHLSGGTGVTYNAGEISIGQDVSTTATPTFGNITTTGYIAGPSTFTIDPAAVGDNTGTLVIAGNLQVDGTTTTINSTTMTVDDLNITLASGAANAAAANGAGITVDGASATLTYNGTNDDWNFNKDINVTGTATMDSLTVDGPVAINSNSFVQTTATPAYNLIESDVTDENTQLIQASGTFRIRTVDDAGSSAVERMRIDHGTGDISFYEDTGTTAKLFWDASTERFGIGTTAPADELEIEGTDPAIRWDDTSAGGYARLEATNGSMVYESDQGNSVANSTHIFKIDGTERMRVNTTGVGIGTTSPDQLLDVGDHTAVGNRSIRISQRTGTAAQTYGGIEFFYNNTAGTTGVNAAIKYASGPLRNDGELTFHTGASASISERLRIDHNGNVGIGTSSPVTRLEVEGSNSELIRISSSSGNSGSVVGTGSLGLDYFSGTTNPAVLLSAHEDSSATYLSEFSISLRASNADVAPTERMRIDSSGNIGIAGAAQSFGAGVATLQLKGLSSSQATRAGALRFISNNGTSCDTAIYSDNGFMSFYTGTSTSQNLNLQIDAYGGLNIKSVAGTQAATFGGSNLVNGITALPSSAGVPFVVGRDTGSTKSATFAGHVNINTGYGLSFDDGSNYLDDYEEGTWTPVLSGSVSHSSSNQRYVKIGNLVYVTAYVYSIADYTSAVNLTISGLPYATNASRGVGSVMFRDINNSTIAQMNSYVATNSSTIFFYFSQNNGGGWDTLEYADGDAGLMDMIFNLTYMVN